MPQYKIMKNKIFTLSVISNAAKNFDVLANSVYIIKRFIYYYFDNPTKLFLDLYVAKFLDTSVKSFFSCMTYTHYFLCIIILTWYFNTSFTKL